MQPPILTTRGPAACDRIGGPLCLAQHRQGAAPPAASLCIRFGARGAVLTLAVLLRGGDRGHRRHCHAHRRRRR
eukprot:2884307-Rhodomonas_salina.6